MSSKPYDLVLEEARQLPPDEQQRLIRELSTPLAAPKKSGEANGAAPVADSEVRTLYDVLEASGLVGFMTDGPGDLSTNPKHMEGFGRDAE